MIRTADIHRKTAETDVRVKLELEGAGGSKISTGVGFFDHMLQTVARHGGFNIEVDARGDVETGDHHTVEDVGICLGEAFKKALGEKAGIVRFGSSACPMDEALARAVVDLSGRPHLECDFPVPLHDIGNFQGDSMLEFFRAFSNSCACTLHLDLLRGGNLHHCIEALCKAFALALRQAAAVRPGQASIPSTKGTL